jgi:hypothetical protein
MSPNAARALCPHCSADVLSAGAECWLCGKPLPAEIVENALIQEALRAPMTLGGSRDLESTNFGLIFLLLCLGAGGFTLSLKFGALFLVLLLPAAGWLLMDHAPASRPAKAQESSSVAAWTVAAIAILPISLALALISTGLAAFDGGSLLRAIR